MDKLLDVTTERQNCAICQRAIRKDASWFKMTECPHPHFFHYGCWSDYVHAEEARTGRRQFLRVPCPVCRHLQMSEAEFMLACGVAPPGCAICLREEHVKPFSSGVGIASVSIASHDAPNHPP